MIRFVAVFLTLGLLLSACQKGQEQRPEEPNVQKNEVKQSGTTQSTEAKQKALTVQQKAETEVTYDVSKKDPEEKLNRMIQAGITSIPPALQADLNKKAIEEIKRNKESLEATYQRVEEETRQAAEAVKEIKPGPITEAEQRFIEKVGSGATVTPEAFGSRKAALKYLKILLKADHKTIKLYDGFEKLPEPEKKTVYDESIAGALNEIIPKEGYESLVEILKTKRDYPVSLSTAAKIVKHSKDKDVISTLKEIVTHKDPRVRLEAAGSLLALGDGDTALPILDDLAKKEGYSRALYYLFRKPGEIIDERGYEIAEKALKHTNAGIKLTAVKLLLESKKMTKQAAEEIALQLVVSFKDKTEKDYGIGRRQVKNETYSKTYLLSGYEGRTLEELEESFRSDSRACDTAIYLLGDLRSQRAIKVLQQIKGNIAKRNKFESFLICWEDGPINMALDKILEKGGKK